MLSSFISTTSVIASLLTLSGVLLHDTRLDKATVLAANPPQVSYVSLSSKAVLQGDAHTHVERSSFSQAMRIYQTSTPGVQPRSDERRHVMQRHVSKGHHAFDNYNLPLV